MNLPLLTSVGLPKSGRDTFMCMLAEMLHDEGWHRLIYLDTNKSLLSQIANITPPYHGTARKNYPILLTNHLDHEDQQEYYDYSRKLITHVIRDDIKSPEFTPQWMFKCSDLFIRNPGNFRRFKCLVSDLYFNDIQPRLEKLL